MHSREPHRVILAQLPTPVVELKNLARELGVQRILMKRDDMTGVETSGNKVRKLEYVVADALRTGCDTLVTQGGYQSNHCRATAAIGARLGLKVRLMLRMPETPPANDGNLFLDRLFGAQITTHSADEFRTRKQELALSAMDEERVAGRKPYFFPVGASVPLGCWGYIRAVRELATQLGRDATMDVFVAVGSSGTLAGMILGKALFRCEKWRIIGVPICDSAPFFMEDVRQLIDQTIVKHELDLREFDTPIELLDGFIGEGYALPYAESIETLNTVARTEGILLDPTYTSKAMTGMVDAIAKQKVRKGATPVFIHTGGVFGLMARRDLFPV